MTFYPFFVLTWIGLKTLSLVESIRLIIKSCQNLWLEFLSSSLSSYDQLYLNKRGEVFCFQFNYFCELHSAHLRSLVFTGMHNNQSVTLHFVSKPQNSDSEAPTLNQLVNLLLLTPSCENKENWFQGVLLLVAFVYYGLLRHCGESLLRYCRDMVGHHCCDIVGHHCCDIAVMIFCKNCSWCFAEMVYCKVKLSCSWKLLQVIWGLLIWLAAIFTNRRTLQYGISAQHWGGGGGGGCQIWFAPLKSKSGVDREDDKYCNSYMTRRLSTMKKKISISIQI